MASTLDKIKKDKPRYVEFDLPDRTESMEVPEKTRGKWKRIQNAIDALEWTKITTRDVDGKLLNIHDPDTDPSLEDTEPEKTLAVDQIDLNSEFELVQTVRAVTAAQEAIVAPVLRALTDMHQLTIGNIQAQYNLVLDRLDTMESKHQELLERNAELAEKTAKSKTGDNGLNEQMMGFLAKAAPGLLKGVLAQPQAPSAPPTRLSHAVGDPELPPETPKPGDVDPEPQ